MTYFLFDFFRRWKNKFNKYDRFARVSLTIDKPHVVKPFTAVVTEISVFCHISSIWPFLGPKCNAEKRIGMSMCNSYRIFQTVKFFLNWIFVFILHVFVIYFVTLDPRHGPLALDMEPLTLDPRRKDRLRWRGISFHKPQEKIQFSTFWLSA